MRTPYALHRAIQIVSMSDAPDAAEVQGALGVVSGRMVLLEETLKAVLEGGGEAHDRAWQLLVGD